MITSLLILSLFFGVWVGASVADYGTARDDANLETLGEIWIWLSLIINSVSIAAINA